MRVLIVLAHPERDSFNGMLARQAETRLSGLGHDVVVSDLYALGFDPISDRRNFLTTLDSRRLDLQAEESLASKSDGYVLPLQAEMDKLAWCDLLILQFPLWWLGPPAILKGWIDRVLAIGRAYGGGRWFDEGFFVGKRAMCVLTTGGPAALYSKDGACGAMDEILLPLNRGTLGFVGFTVLEPVVFYGPRRWMSEAECNHAVDRYLSSLQDIDRMTAIPQPSAEKYRRQLQSSRRQ